MKGKKEKITIKQEDLPKVRRVWEIKPFVRVKDSDKKYNRKKEKKTDKDSY